MYGMDPVDFFSTETGSFLDNVRRSVVDEERVNHVVVINCDHRPTLVIDGLEDFAINLIKRVVDIWAGGKRIGVIEEVNWSRGMYIKGGVIRLKGVVV